MKDICTVHVLENIIMLAAETQEKVRGGFYLGGVILTFGYFMKQYTILHD